MTNQDAQEYFNLYLLSVKKSYGKLPKSLTGASVSITNEIYPSHNFKEKKLFIPSTSSGFDLFLELEHLRASVIDKRGKIHLGIIGDYESEMKRGICFDKALSKLSAQRLYLLATDDKEAIANNHVFWESVSITMQLGAVLGLSAETFCAIRDKIDKGREYIQKLFINLNSKISYSAFENNCDLLHTLNEMSKNPSGSDTPDAHALRKTINNTLFQTLEVALTAEKIKEKEYIKRFHNFCSYIQDATLNAEMQEKANAILQLNKR